MKSSVASLLLVGMLSFGGHAAAQQAAVLTLAGQIPLPDVKGRIDHFSVDVKGQRLFMAGVGNHTLEILDLQTNKRVKTITNLAEPQGVYFDPATNRLYVACGLDGVTNIYDGASFQLVGSVKFPDDADNIRYDARSKSVIVGYAGAKELRKRVDGTGGLGFIDSSGKKTRDIVIDAHPESFRLEEKGTRLFVNVPDKKEIEVVDTEKGTILARWPVTTSKNNFPMSLDEADHRLLVGAWTPPRLLVFDTESGKQVAALPLGEQSVADPSIVGATDDLFYDATRRRVYVLNARGAIDVFRQDDPDHYALIGSVPTPLKTQTGLFVPEWGKLFVGVIQQGTKSAEVQVYQAK